MVTEQRAIDQDKLMAFLGKAVGDFGATISAGLVVLGDRLGIYRAMAGAGPLTAAEIGERTGVHERYLHPWLVNQAAGGYIEYDAATATFTLPPEQAAALADESSPFFVAGGFQLLTAALKAEPRIEESFRSGAGMRWGEHDHGLFEGTERFFRPGYIGNLVSSWLPALDGVVAKLERGATVADIGCGHGASTIIMAQAYPQSRFFGFDDHAPSITAAQERAKAAGVADRVTFAVASAQSYPGADYDLIAFFDCLHDMGDPAAAARHTRAALAPDGTAMIIEPMAGERVEDNLNPVGRVFAGASVLVCTPHALATGGKGLGTIAPEERLRQVVVDEGGFTRFRRATETPFNRVFEARP